MRTDRREQGYQAYSSSPLRYRQFYTVFAALQSSPYLREVIDTRGAVPKKVAELQDLLTQVKNGAKVDVRGIGASHESSRRRERDSGSSDESSDDRHRPRHAKKPRRRSASPDLARGHYSWAGEGRKKSKVDGRAEKAPR